MFLRGYVTNSDKKYNNQKNKISDIDKRFKYNSTYEPIRGSDIFNELPPKNIKNQPD